MKQILLDEPQRFTSVPVHRQRRVQEETASAAVPGRSEPFYIAMNAELNFRGIGHQQHGSAELLCEVSSVFEMRFKNGAMINRIIVEKTVRGLEVGPVLGLVRRASIGALCKLSCHSHESLCPSFVAEIAASKLLLRPLIHIESHLKHLRPPPYAIPGVVRLPPWHPGMHHTSCEADWRKLCTIHL